MAKEEKLDWIYKGANSLVDREEYLLGRKVDKTLEQINEEEKEKKFVLPTPKNHVEHECIPPSIRDFNKIVQSEQVDLSAKLQEDPLVAIKKREEEARKQFLQNPVQLKKLQEALQKKEKQKKKHKKSKKNDDLDEKLREKLAFFKGSALGIGASNRESKKDKEEVLNTILMHKFNELKDKLSEDDLKDILNGHVTESSSEEDKPKKKKKKGSSSESESEEEKLKTHRKCKNPSKEKGTRSDNDDQRRQIIKKRDHSNSNEDSDRRRRSRSNSRNRRHKLREKNSSNYREDNYRDNNRKARKSRTRSRSRSPKSTKPSKSMKNDRNATTKQSLMEERRIKNKDTKKSDLHKKNKSSSSSGNEEDSELDRRIMERLKMLRGEAEAGKNEGHSKGQIDSSEKHSKNTRVMLPEKPSHLIANKSSSSSSSSSPDREVEKYKYSDSEEESPRKHSFGLVTSDGKKINLKKGEFRQKDYGVAAKKVEKPATYERKHVKKMSEEEKERLRKEMMANAKARDKEREENLKRYRESDKKEEETLSKKYDKQKVHTELLKSVKHSSVEERIKSNLNKIQRSSKHMNQNFSRR